MSKIVSIYQDTSGWNRHDICSDWTVHVPKTHSRGGATTSSTQISEDLMCWFIPCFYLFFKDPFRVLSDCRNNLTIDAIQVTKSAGILGSFQTSEIISLKTLNKWPNQARFLRLLRYIRTSHARSFIFSWCSIRRTSIDEEKLIRLSL